MNSSPEIRQTLNIDLTNNSITLSPANKPHKYTLIFLHGYAMPIQSFLRVFLSPVLLDLLSDFKIYIPQAPKRFSNLKLQEGIQVYSWYDRENPATLHEITEEMTKVIHKEIEILDNDSSRVFLGGFSQGSALSLHIIHTLKEKLGGVVIIGGLVSKAAKLPQMDELPPVLIIHGMKDTVKTWEESKATYGSLLERKEVQAVLIEDMKHDINHPQAQKVIYEFLRQQTGTLKTNPCL